MSTSSSIEVLLHRNNDQKISAIQLISTFILGKWRLEDEGKILYLPLGDHDNYN